LLADFAPSRLDWETANSLSAIDRKPISETTSSYTSESYADWPGSYQEIVKIEADACSAPVVGLCTPLTEQVPVLPIGDEPKLLDYARSVQTELRAHQVRCELDASTDHIKAKIANAEQMKVHTMLVIGNRDMEANAVSVRVHGQGNLGAKSLDEVIAEILSSIRERRS
jgi:histidyl-tRNA synthetase